MLADRHIVITGGGTGIGAAIAEAMARHRSRITLMGRRVDVLNAERSRLGCESQAVQVDVATPESVERAFAQARRAFGAVDVLINNAGQVASAPFTRTGLDQ